MVGRGITMHHHKRSAAEHVTALRKQHVVRLEQHKFHWDSPAQ